ncbi:MAG: hypothetical protein M9945_07935 [Aquamicrobium sp.]|uniref:hypothetical protein n=1 Tax=Aquamicrobium sp. TaxID=1872579 RepID=UPI00349E8E2D|nr:hypothetical protein [Aquamicrobium sp.]
MRIKDARAVRQEPNPRGFRMVARFGLEVVDGVVIFDCSIVQAPDGRMLVYGPLAKNGAPILALAPDIRRDIVSMTLQQVGIDDREYASAA